MRPLFTTLVWLTVAAHFLFLIYLPSGGFLALALRSAGHHRGSRWAIRVHVAAVLWAVGSVTLHFWCPLTALEQWARLRAGLAPLGPAGFIDHYLTGVLYPGSATGVVQGAALAGVLLSWGLYLAAGRHAPLSAQPAGAR